MTQQISQVLKETGKPQAFNTLAHIVYGEEHQPESIDSYCALGVLACNHGLITPSHPTANYEAILRSYEVPEDLLEIDFSKELDFGIPHRDKSTGRWRDDLGWLDRPHRLSDLIYQLNDTARLSFKEIGEFLEVSLGL